MRFWKEDDDDEDEAEEEDVNAESSATWRPEEQTLAVSQFRRTNCSLILNKTCKYML